MTSSSILVMSSGHVIITISVLKSPTRIMSYTSSPLFLYSHRWRRFTLLFWSQKCYTSGFLPNVSALLDAAGGGRAGWEGEEVGREGWLVGQQTEAAASPQCLSVLTAGNAGLEALLTAAKCRSILALDGLWSHWRRTSTRALITVDTQRLPRDIERPSRLILH